MNENIFLIYAVKDADDESKIKWIADFKRYFELLLGRVTKHEIRIRLISDKELDIDSIYTPYTLLIPFVSENLLNSETFNEEIKIFHDKAINKGLNSISWNSRIFKIVKSPLSGNFLLDFLSNSSSYLFHHYDRDRGCYVEYESFSDDVSENLIWMRLYDLVYDVSRIFVELESAEEEIRHISNGLNSISVYLAEVGNDISHYRDSLKRELLRHGYKVLPIKNVPDDPDAARKMIKKEVSECKMSIHLVGSDYSKIKGTNISVIELQHQLAVEHFRDLEKLGDSNPSYYGSVIWISPNISTINVKHRLFIDNLRKNAEAIKKSELLEATFEEFKSYVIHWLEDGEAGLAGQKPKEQDGRKKVIYLIYDKSESEKCRTIENYLVANGYSVITSDYQGTPEEMRAMHNENLKKCDATLIYYGLGNRQWIKSKQKDLLKSLGLGREKPINPKAILIENEDQLDELLNVDNDSMVINTFSPETLEPFLAQLEKYE